MDVYQCPDCVLRFRYASELEHHITDEHPDFQITPKTIEDSLIGASRRHRHHDHKLGPTTNAG